MRTGFMSLAFCLLSAPWTFAAQTPKPKMIISLSPPRGQSTLWTRAMEAQTSAITGGPLLKVMHENLSGVGSKRIYPFFTALTFSSSPSYEEVRKGWLQARQKGHVFVKEIAGLAEESLLQDTHLLQDPDVFFVLQIRHPEKIFTSFYKAMELDSGWFRRTRMSYIFDRGATNHQALYRALKHLRKHAPDRFLVMNSEDFIANPAEVIQKVLQAAKIEDYAQPIALQWPRINTEDLEAVQEFRNRWGDCLRVKNFLHWHKAALGSEHIIQRPAQPQLSCKFSSLPRSHAQLLGKYCRQDLAYYNYLKKM